MIYRKAKMADVPEIHKLINGFAERGLMLAKPLIAIYENLREYVVVEDNQKVVGVGGLHILWSDLAEVRSLAVHQDYHHMGIGKCIVDKLEEEARELGIPKLFALTYQEDFFHSIGFHKIDNKLLPQKVWTECINCPKFPNCDEVAMLKEL